MSNLVAQLISPERIKTGVETGSKKRALELLAELLASAQPNLTTEEIFACMVRRERLGSTGVGNGMALPHGRLHGLSESVCALLKLAEGVDYDASDEQPVDVLFAMLVPEDAEQRDLDTLAELAEMLTDKQFADQLRQAESADAICSACEQFEPVNAN